MSRCCLGKTTHKNKKMTTPDSRELLRNHNAMKDVAENNKAINCEPGNASKQHDAAVQIIASLGNSLPPLARRSRPNPKSTRDPNQIKKPMPA